MFEGQGKGRYQMKMARGIIFNGGNVWVEVRSKDAIEITLLLRSRI